MINNVEKETLKESLRNLKGKKVAVFGHEAPDGDCIGSTIGMGSLLKKLGATPFLFNRDDVPPQFLFLGDDTLRVRGEDQTLQVDRIIVVDCAKELRIGIDIRAYGVPIINIDHHISNDGFGDLNYILEAGATAEIIGELYGELTDEMDVVGATALYTGIMTDTGNLTFESTTEKTVSIVAYLLRNGADMNRMRRELYENTPLSQLEGLRVVLDHLDVRSGGRIAYTYLSYEDLSRLGLKNGDLDGFINYPRQLSTCDVALFFKETEEGVVKVSVRTKGNVDANKLASSFGGGGHMRAAGFRKTAPMDFVLTWALDKIEEGLTSDEWLC